MQLGLWEQTARAEPFRLDAELRLDRLSEAWQVPLLPGEKNSRDRRRAKGEGRSANVPQQVIEPGCYMTRPRLSAEQTQPLRPLPPLGLLRRQSQVLPHRARQLLSPDSNRAGQSEPPLLRHVDGSRARPDRNSHRRSRWLFLDQPRQIVEREDIDCHRRGLQAELLSNAKILPDHVPLRRNHQHVGQSRFFPRRAQRL